jgi:hypothetical protein
MLSNNNYMIKTDNYSIITGDNISQDQGNYVITNDEYSLQIDLQNNTLISNYTQDQINANFIQEDDSLLIPIDLVAKHLGYEVEQNDTQITLSRPFSAKRLIIDSEYDINLLYL